MPSWSKISMRWLPRSATKRRPSESNASAWGVRNSPCSVPIRPHSVMNVPSGGELQDATGGARLAALRYRPCGGHALAAVSVRDVDAAVRPGDHVGRLVELVRAASRLARRAEAHQQLARGAELVDLMPLGPLLVPREVGHPYVAVGIHVDAVRGDHDAAAEVRQHLPGVAVELEDRVDGVGVAVDPHAAAEGSGAAALVCPDLAVARVDVDTGGRAPLPAFGQVAPIRHHGRGRVRQTVTRDRVARRRGRGWLGRCLGLADARPECQNSADEQRAHQVS